MPYTVQVAKYLTKARHQWLCFDNEGDQWHAVQYVPVRMNFFRSEFCLRISTSSWLLMTFRSLYRYAQTASKISPSTQLI